MLCNVKCGEHSNSGAEDGAWKDGAGDLRGVPLQGRVASADCGAVFTEVPVDGGAGALASRAPS